MSTEKKKCAKGIAKIEELFAHFDKDDYILFIHVLFADGVRYQSHSYSKVYDLLYGFTYAFSPAWLWF